MRIDPPAAHRRSEEPFDLVRLAVGSVALLGTILALVLAVVTHDARILQLVGALWAVYGLTVGFLSGVLEPVLDGLFHLLLSGASLALAPAIPVSRRWLHGAIMRLPPKRTFGLGLPWCISTRTGSTIRGAQ